MDGAKPNQRKFVAALGLLAWGLVTLYHLGEDVGPYHFVEDVGPYRDHRGSSRQLLLSGDPSSPPELFDVCGRAAGFHSESWALQQKYNSCPLIEEDRPILLLAGHQTYGRTGNRLRSLLYALQYARDHKVHLGIMYDSWAMRVLLEFFFAGGNDGKGADEGWRSHVERALCVEVFRQGEDLHGRKVILKTQKELFFATSRIPIEELVASQTQLLRTLWRDHNAGQGHDMRGYPAKDACSGIDALFGGGAPGAMYSVVHLRYFEGKGARRLKKTARGSGCDPEAAAGMAPDYVRALLAPLGMLDHPVVVVTDGQDQTALERLKGDPELGPLIREVPEEARWFGGDVALAVMADAFIGNPASTMSGFVAQSRAALGRENTFMHMARNERGEWTAACETCLFRPPSNSPQGEQPPPEAPRAPPKSRISTAQWQEATEGRMEGRIASAGKAYTSLRLDEAMARIE